MKAFDLNITRLDYKNPSDKGYHSLSPLNNIDDIQDVNEIFKISLIFDKDEDARAFVESTPRYLGLRVSNQIDQDENGFYKRYIVSKNFNTMFLNDVTGDKNETAAKHRERLIKIIKKYKKIQA